MTALPSLREQTVDQFLPDIIAPDLAVLFCGINPGLHAAHAGHHFAGGSNRFWRVLNLAGFTPELMPAQDDYRILDYGYGLTTVVERATSGADDLTAHDFTMAAEAFAAKIERYAPRNLAFLGKVAYAGLIRQRNLEWGPQAEPFCGAKVWILPNPSGRNRAFSLDGLIRAYGEFHASLEYDQTV